MFVRLLKRDLSCTITEAENGEEAFRLITEARLSFDVVFMDSVMPVMDGPTATKNLRDSGYSGKIFGVTGSIMEDEVRTFLLSGVDRVLSKPVDPATFIPEIRSACLPSLQAASL